MKPRFSLALVVAAATAMLLLVLTPVEAYASSSILGGGSGFAALEIDQWRADTARSPFNLNINYVAQGSSFGRQQFTAGTFDYAASDIQYMQSEIPDIQGKRCGGKALTSCFNYVPVSAGGLAFMYNVNTGAGPLNLKLTRRAACKIFTGAITKWNDPELVATNPSLAADSADITPVVRADGAGESYVLSEFCIAVAPDVWNTFRQHMQNGGDPNLTVEFTSGQPTSVWPQQGWGANPVPVATADGTASYVADPTSGPNSITYVAAGYAKVRNFPTASVQNAAGQFTQPDEENVTVALGYASPRGNGTFQLAFNGPDPRAYFPSTYSYVLAQTAGFDPGKGATLAQFLCYAVSKGQAIAPSLRYARLSSALVDIAINAITAIPGAPTKASCPVAGAPPPPPPPSVLGGGGGGAGGSTGGSAGNGGSSGLGGLSGLSGLTGGTPAARRAAALKAAALQKAAAAKRQAELTGGAAADGTGTGAVEATNIDAKLKAAAATAPPSSQHATATIWLLVAGAAVAWGVTTVLRRRSSV